jgi:predicted aspartyl protease
MGRIVTPLRIANAFDPTREIRCDALVDTGTTGVILPTAWKERLGSLTSIRTVELETADQRVVPGEVCGPVRIHIEGFDEIFDEVIFMDLHPEDGAYEPLLGYVVLEKSRAAVDMVGHRLVPVKHLDLKKFTGCSPSSVREPLCETLGTRKRALKP